MEATKQIGRAAGKFFSGTALSRLSGFLRDVVTAAVFGATPETAAFFMAFRFANLPRRLFGEGAMHSAFVPHYEGLRGKEEKTFARSLILLLAMVLAAIVLVGEGVLFFVGGEVSHFTKLMLPAVVFLCLYGTNTALLNCEKIYFLPSAAPVAFNLVWIVGVLSGKLEVLALVVTVACLAQWLATLVPVMRVIRGARFSWASLKGFLVPLGLAMLGVGATQINSALDAVFARMADPSGPAYLWYAIRLQQVPLALFGIGLTGALLPPLSRAIKGGEDFKPYLRFAYKWAMLLMVTATIGLWVVPVVNWIYGHGAFDAGVATTTCLRMYALGLLPQTLVLIQSTLFYAHGDYKTPAKISAFAVLVNVGLNSYFVFGRGWGAESIALATSLSSMIQLTFCVLGSRRLQRRLEEEGTEPDQAQVR